MRKLAFALAATAATIPAAAFAMEGVVASIKPVHSLVAGVMEGIGEPELIVQGAGSPHNFSMRPSDAAALERSRLVFWIGRDMESFLEGPLATLASNATLVTLEETPGLVKLGYREGGAFEAHAHGDGDAPEHEHEHDDHGDHGHGHNHDSQAHGERHGQDEAEHASHGHDHGHDDEAHGHAGEDARSHDHGDDHGDHHDHAHGEFDLHLWLDPENARAMVGEIERALAEADPENAARYAENAAGLRARLDDLVAEIEPIVAPVRSRPFIVFHDAYHYFENRFGMQAAGAITINPDTAPGAQRLSEIRARIGELDAACVFAEPQFEPRVIGVVSEGTDARTGVLDPLGAEIEDGPDLYFELVRTLATSFADCLSP